MKCSAVLRSIAKLQKNGEVFRKGEAAFLGNRELIRKAGGYLICLNRLAARRFANDRNTQ
jgi:hypothetical protein